MPAKKFHLPLDRDFPTQPTKAVCKRCHMVLQDFEPCSAQGEFFHPKEAPDGKPSWCQNAGKTFTTRDLEIQPFLRKRVRRAHKRMGIRP